MALPIPQEYFEAGRIASEARGLAEKITKPGALIIEICNSVEGFIRGRGAKPAFPCNVSVNSVAAHYTSNYDDQRTIHEGDLVKIDLGAHINGYLVDTAMTVCLNPAYYELTQATEIALKEAMKIARAGVRAGEIGRTISSIAERWGFRPITNLCGHSIEPYRVHAGLSIPNVWVPGTGALRADSVYAIEPFLTVRDSFGEIEEGEARNIYSLVARRPSGDKASDRFVDMVWSEYRTLPFAPRYFSSEYRMDELQSILRRLVARRTLKAYPELVEPSGKMVAQFEHTIAVTEEGPTVLT